MKLNPNETFKPKCNNIQVFTAEDEKSLSSYLVLASKMNYTFQLNQHVH